MKYAIHKYETRVQESFFNVFLMHALYNYIKTSCDAQFVHDIQSLLTIDSNLIQA